MKFTLESKECFSFFKDSNLDTKLSYSSLRDLKSCSTCFDLQRALLFWNHIATWRGWRPSSLATSAFFLGSSLVSDSNMVSRSLICSSLNLLWFVSLLLLFFVIGFGGSSEKPFCVGIVVLLSMAKR